MLTLACTTACPLSPAEIAARENLEVAENRIKQIRAKFDKQTKRLASKREGLDAETRECEAEARAIAQALREFALARKKARTVCAVCAQECFDLACCARRVGVIGYLLCAAIHAPLYSLPPPHHHHHARPPARSVLRFAALLIT